MSDQESARRDPEQLLDRLDTTDCHYCDGDLDAGTYKGSEAILCEDCGTPAVRVW
ncbi:HVO_A0556 family zinc finger protein [Halobellus sp. EA9]|uniref:HVO_A0556 family zinc finger protein n=1 Tax=Halobellus sp. EA9 TaxID=3421647 RepID=UPI003EBA824F